MLHLSQPETTYWLFQYGASLRSFTGNSWDWGNIKNIQELFLLGTGLGFQGGVNSIHIHAVFGP